jgi:hypothetical protein
VCFLQGQVLVVQQRSTVVFVGALPRRAQRNAHGTRARALPPPGAVRVLCGPGRGATRRGRGAALPTYVVA